MDKLPEINIGALPGLLEALNDGHDGVRRTAMRNIGRLGKAAAPHALEIASLLKDPSAGVKQATTWALGELGGLATQLVVGALADPDCRPTAERALRKTYPYTFSEVVFAPAQLVAGQEKPVEIPSFPLPDNAAMDLALGHPDSEIRLAAIYCLGKCTISSGTLLQLEKALADDSPAISLGAAATICKHFGWHLDPQEHPILFDSLLTCLNSPTKQEVSGAIHVLASLDESAVGFLATTLLCSTVDLETKKGILHALPDLDEVAGTSIPAIRAAFITSPELGEDALMALGKLCKGNPETHQLFLAALADPETQFSAVRAIENMGSAAFFAGPTLIPFLEAKDDELRSATQHTIAAIGKEMTPLLVEQLHHGQINRESTMAVLSKLGGNAAGAVYELVALLKGEDEKLACLAATTLGRIGPAASEAVGALAETLESGFGQLLSRCTFALGQIGGDAVPALLNALANTPQTEAKILIIEALGKVEPPTPLTVLPISRSLLDEDQAVQNAAASVLVGLGSQAASGINIFEKALMHHSRTVRSHAANILANLGPNAVSAIPALIKTLRLGRIPARKLAALALAKLAGLSPRVVPELRWMLKSRDKDIVVAAAIALGGIGEGSWLAAPDLIRVLGHRKAKHSPEYRLVSGSIIREASSALVKIGPAAVPAIIKALKRRQVTFWDELLSLLPIWGNYETSVVSKPRIRRYLVRALQETGPAATDALPILCQVIQDKDSDLRARAESALGAIGNIKDRELNILSQALYNRDSGVRSHVASVLGSFGRTARLAVPALISLLKDRDAGVRKKAIVTLGKIGPAARGSVAPLINIIDTEDHEQAHLVAKAVQQIGLTDPLDAQAIIQLARSKRNNLRWYAASILGLTSKASADTTELLQWLTHDPDSAVAQEAAASLQKVHPESH